MAIQDTIERQMTFRVPRQTVWAAITEPDQIARWFGTGAELDLRPGGVGTLSWENLGFTTSITVEAVDPPSRFSYRWRSNREGPTTLVEFRLEEISNGTRLTLVESGFAQLGDDSWQGNEYGWDEELGELRAFLLEKAAA